MSGRTLHWLGLGLVTTAGAGVMALTAMMNSAFAYGDVPPDPADPTIGLVMGPSGLPLPEFNLPGYVEAANNLYIDNPLHPNFPDTTYPGPYADGLFTPEYPLLSVPFSINYPTATTGPLAGFPDLNTSVGQGMLILENAIATNTAAGDASTVFGWSQSATISSLVMQQLDPSGQPMPNDGLQFVLIGDPSAPNGGLSERFDGLNLPSLGLSFDGATPANDFPTDIYTLEYDGYADFPQYPINFLADLNAVLGTIDIHGLYLDQGLDPPEPGPTAEQIANAILLPGSAADGTTDSLTNYYMIDETPPLVTLLSDIPVIGQPLADLLGPDLTVLINLGYGADNLGYSTPANVPTRSGCSRRQPEQRPYRAGRRGAARIQRFRGGPVGSIGDGKHSGRPVDGGCRSYHGSRSAVAHRHQRRAVECGRVAVRPGVADSGHRRCCGEWLARLRRHSVPGQPH